MLLHASSTNFLLIPRLVGRMTCTRQHTHVRIVVKLDLYEWFDDSDRTYFSCVRSERRVILKRIDIHMVPSQGFGWRK
jgi:hypothetical protein